MKPAGLPACLPLPPNASNQCWRAPAGLARTHLLQSIVQPAMQPEEEELSEALRVTAVPQPGHAPREGQAPPLPGLQPAAAAASAASGCGA